MEGEGLDAGPLVYLSFESSSSSRSMSLSPSEDNGKQFVMLSLFHLQTRPQSSAVTIATSSSYS